MIDSRIGVTTTTHPAYQEMDWRSVWRISCIALLPETVKRSCNAIFVFLLKCMVSLCIFNDGKTKFGSHWTVCERKWLPLMGIDWAAVSLVLMRIASGVLAPTIDHCVMPKFESEIGNYCQWYAKSSTSDGRKLRISLQDGEGRRTSLYLQRLKDEDYGMPKPNRGPSSALLPAPCV